MFIRSVCENQPVVAPISLRNGSVAMPPPMANRPVLKNSQYKRRYKVILPPSLKIFQHDAGHRREQHEPHRRNAQQHIPQQHDNKDDRRALIHDRLFQQLEHSVQDEHAYTHLNACKGVLHPGKVGKVRNESRQIVIMTSEGNTTPSVAVMPPIAPFLFCPTNVAVLTAMMPVCTDRWQNSPPALLPLPSAYSAPPRARGSAASPYLRQRSSRRSWQR